jgi:hypothetical protein
MGAAEGHQKSIYSTSKKKNKTKNSFGIYPTEFAGSTQNLKKRIETQNQPIETKKILKKSMFCTLREERSQIFVWRLPDGIFWLESISLNKYRNTKSTNQNKNYPKKRMFSTSKVKRSQQFV